jgi:hypothetical protein
MLANSNSCMHADQDQPRNKMGKNMKEGTVFVNEITKFNV